MQEITHTVTEPSGEKKVVSSRKPISHKPAFDVEKLPKNQQQTAKEWNEMRDLLILIGEMESK